MIFESQNLAVIFLLRWNFLPTRFQQPGRSTCVGFLPMGFPPIGLRRFKSETLLSLLRSNCALDSSKPMKRSQIRIWDPGENGSAYKEFWIANRSWSDLPPLVFDEDEPRRWPITSLDWIPNRLITWRVWQQYGHDDTLSPAFVLGFGLIAERILSSDDGDACKSRAVSFSSLAMIYRSSQSFVNLIYVLCLWYNHQSRHEPIVAYGGFHCLVTVKQIQAMSFCLIYISYTIEIHKRLLCLYHEDIICSIPSSVLWWHWRRLSWQQWITQRLPNKLCECLPE